MIEIGAFEAKTHFSEILKKVGEGEVYCVTKRGKLVAIICSPETQRIERVSNAYKKFIDLRNKFKIASIDEVTEWKNEGRE